MTLRQWLKIPWGMYCYYTSRGDTCPFWHNDGTCELCSDETNEGSIILWDQCKECGAKEIWRVNHIRWRWARLKKHFWYVPKKHRSN